MRDTHDIQRSTALALLSVLILIGCGRIAATYSVLNQTYDEPLHLACGMEMLCRGTNTYGHAHPPLAQTLMAAGPYLDGVRFQAHPGFLEEGDALLYGGGKYWRVLTLARLGNLPFYLLACLAVYWWGSRWFSRTTALCAVFLFSTLPPILGHAGLATNDVACCAAVAVALYCLVTWIEEPSWKRTAALGAGLALAVLSKFSAAGYVAACGMVVAGLQWRTLRLGFARRAGQFAVAVLAGVVLIWAGYRFSFHSLGTLPKFPQILEKAPALAKVSNIPIPFPELFVSLANLVKHNGIPHDSYLLGHFGIHWWYFFPVVLVTKTPIGLLLLVLAAAITAARWLDPQRPGRLAALVAPAVIMGVAMSSRIDLGVRHLLPIFPFLAILGAQAAIWLSGRTRPRWMMAAALLLVGFDAIHTAAAGIDQLPYFNPLAGSHPERILCESDLDWGQDLNRLSIRLKQLSVQRVSIGYFGTARIEAAGLPEFTPIDGKAPVAGDVAVSVRLLTLQADKDGSFAWLKGIEPAERIGKSIYLFHLPPFSAGR